MNFTQAKSDYLNTLKQQENCKTTTELIAKIGRTTIRCGWVDYVDFLIKDHQVSEKVAYKWGQVL